MTEHERPPSTRRERLKRSLAVNAYWGIGNAGCHDIEISSTYKAPEPAEGEDFYTIILDTETGEIRTEPG